VSASPSSRRRGTAHRANDRALEPPRRRVALRASALAGRPASRRPFEQGCAPHVREEPQGRRG
jgi:hypothetical protein